MEGLEGHKNQIESELYLELDWQRLENRRACRIIVVRPGSIEDDADTLAEIQDWMVKNLLNFKKVFSPKLAELVA